MIIQRHFIKLPIAWLYIFCFHHLCSPTPYLFLPELFWELNTDWGVVIRGLRAYFSLKYFITEIFSILEISKEIRYVFGVCINSNTSECGLKMFSRVYLERCTISEWRYYEWVLEVVINKQQYSKTFRVFHTTVFCVDAWYFTAAYSQNILVSFKVLLFLFLSLSVEPNFINATIPTIKNSGRAKEFINNVFRRL